MGSYKEFLGTMESLSEAMNVLIYEQEDLIHFRKALVMIAQLGDSRGSRIAKAALDAAVSSKLG